MDVQARSGGLARGETDALNELLLKIFCEIILSAEENYSSL